MIVMLSALIWKIKGVIFLNQAAIKIWYLSDIRQAFNNDGGNEPRRIKLFDARHNFFLDT